tara:strand:+ start:1999 stop:2265 length:267 start_codon:yes stop_codon:yes gene_type:complete
MQNFFKDDFSMKKAMKSSDSEDGRSYNLGMNNVPLEKSDVDSFFTDWPQYHSFPYKDLLLSGSYAEQCDALISLHEYTVFIDNRVFLF